MTRKDYVLIANCLRIARNREKHQAGMIACTGEQVRAYILARLEALEADLACELQRDNPRFDPDTFYRACRGDK